MDRLQRQVKPAQLRPGYYLAVLVLMVVGIEFTAIGAGKLWGSYLQDLDKQAEIDANVMAPVLDIPVTPDQSGRSSGENDLYLNYFGYLSASGGSTAYRDLSIGNGTTSYAAYYSASGDGNYAFGTSGNVTMGDSESDTVQINGRLVVGDMDVGKELRELKRYRSAQWRR